MWLITNFGFFSIMRKQGETNLTICSHVKQDLVAFCEKYLPGLGEIKPIAGADYRYHASATPTELAKAMSKIVRDITYDNFRNSVAEQQGSRRAYIYSIWESILDLSEEDFEKVDL